MQPPVLYFHFISGKIFFEETARPYMDMVRELVSRYPVFEVQVENKPSTNTPLPLMPDPAELDNFESDTNAAPPISNVSRPASIYEDQTAGTMTSEDEPDTQIQTLTLETTTTGTTPALDALKEELTSQPRPQ